MTSTIPTPLGFGLTFAQLYARDGLVTLDAAFCDYLQAMPELYRRLMAARAQPQSLSKQEQSQLIIDVAPLAEEFIAELFQIRAEVTALKERHFALAPLYSCKRLFVQRKAAKVMIQEQAEQLDGKALWEELVTYLEQKQSDDIRETELVFARHVMSWLDAPELHATQLELAIRYAGWALHSHKGKALHHSGIIFKQPRKLDPLHLVSVETELRHGVTMMKTPHPRHRVGFALTDNGGTLADALNETHYCIWCHPQGKDSCSQGMKEKDANVKASALGVPLAGCPLEEKISEMHFLKSEGIPLGALATIMIDNPMCAGTGHRICNDCMKSCIYQKQDPVNIPQAETRILRDVLELPFGFEIYSLLSHWNPLNIARPLPRPATGYKVLVAGMGPAGYTLAHHLMNDGHTVIGIDGLKIEPLPADISGVTESGARTAFKPIEDVTCLFNQLDERVLAGFGGVAEYGITVRWDKNFLTLIRLLLERRQEFALFGGVRMGSTLTIEKAWELGVDHIALCMGAGKPTILDIPNGMARGVRTASDFLMALQLTGAAKQDSIANLQLRLPVVVIGGGLTAIDTATESRAYYPVQVEKFLSRYERLVRELGEQMVRSQWSEEETLIADEFITHAQQIRQELKKPDGSVDRLLDSWGGVTLAYRKQLTDSPAYRLNHEEIEKALEEGIFIAEGLSPVAVDVDLYGHASQLQMRAATGETTTLPVRTILVAAGTSPNTVLAREDTQHVKMHGKYFQAVNENGECVSPERSCKPALAEVLMSLEPDQRAISFFGDLHPSFAGNVVKAMGSAKQGYPVVSRILAKRPRTSETPDTFIATVNRLLRARIHQVNRLTPTIVEVVVHAPLAAEGFKPGQFYRLQNYEQHALRVPSHGTTLLMEGLALTGASVDKERGLLSTIVLEMGGSSDLCALLKEGEPVVLMGPTGEATEIPHNEPLILVGGGLGNAVLFSIGKQARKQGCNVLYFAGYKKAIDRYKIEEIEAAADVIIWCCDEATELTPTRPQDRFYQGNIVQAMHAYGDGKLGDTLLALADATRMIVIGSDRMMAAVAAARHTVLAPYLRPDHVAIGSINSPMQCMMKEICAQCLQEHIHPVTGEKTTVFSCVNQDQLLDLVSFSHLHARLKQNNVQEKLTGLWVDSCLRALNLRKTAA